MDYNTSLRIVRKGTQIEVCMQISRISQQTSIVKIPKLLDTYSVENSNCKRDYNINSCSSGVKTNLFGIKSRSIKLTVRLK